MDDFLAGPAHASFDDGVGGWEYPADVPDLGAAEAEDLNARLLGEADLAAPYCEDSGPPQFDEESGSEEIDPSWWSEQPEAVDPSSWSEHPEAASSARASGDPENVAGYVSGMGIPGKGKWNNLPTSQPVRGAKGGARGTKRSGGAYASWYRQFYALKKFATDDALQRWLADHPYKGEGKGGGKKGPKKAAAKTRAASGSA